MSIYFRMAYIGKSKESKTFERKGSSYRGFNFKGKNVLGYGNCLFKALVMINLIPFNDHMELRINIMQRIKNYLCKDKDKSGPIIKEFSRHLVLAGKMDQ